MDNIFMYSAVDSPSFRQAAELIQHLDLVSPVYVLPPGSQFTSPLSLNLRGNDILLLFLQTKDELGHLHLLDDELDSFRVVLLIGGEQPFAKDDLLPFSPRFIAYLHQNMNELATFLSNSISRKRDNASLNPQEEQ